MSWMLIMTILLHDEGRPAETARDYFTTEAACERRMLAWDQAQRAWQARSRVDLFAAASCQPAHKHSKGIS